MFCLFARLFMFGCSVYAFYINTKTITYADGVIYDDFIQIFDICLVLLVYVCFHMSAHGYTENAWKMHATLNLNLRINFVHWFIYACTFSVYIEIASDTVWKCKHSKKIYISETLPYMLWSSMIL